VRLNDAFSEPFRISFPPSDARHCGEMHYSATPWRRLLQSTGITHIAVTRPSGLNDAIEFNDIEMCIDQRRR